MEKGRYMSKAETRKLKSLLAGAGHTIESMAAIIGVARPTLSNKVNGKTDFKKSEMESVAAVLGMRPEEIFL